MRRRHYWMLTAAITLLGAAFGFYLGAHVIPEGTPHGRHP